MNALPLAALLCLSPAPPGPDAELDRLAQWLSGSFSSTAQAAADPDFRDIRLEVVPIWPERTDARWLYVEQAVAEKREAPYRQRVYRLSRRPDGTLESAVFTLPDPAAAVGAWKQERPLAALAPDALVPRTGCAIALAVRPDGAFAGGTEGTACPSELRGAAYATSRVVLTADRMESWDRGFDAAGTQVWGAEKGGYVFRRVPREAPRLR